MSPRWNSQPRSSDRRSRAVDGAADGATATVGADGDDAAAAAWPASIAVNIGLTSSEAISQLIFLCFMASPVLFIFDPAHAGADDVSHLVAEGWMHATQT